MKFLKSLIIASAVFFSVASFSEDAGVPSLSTSASNDALSSSLKAEEVKGTSPGILVVLSLENKGENSVKINLNQSVTVDRVFTKGTKIKSLEKFKPNLYEDLGSNAKEVSHKMQVLYLPPGTKKEIYYFVQTSSKGLFYITFVSEKEGLSLPDEKGKDLPLAFYANKIIYIPE